MKRLLALLAPLLPLAAAVRAAAPAPPPNIVMIISDDHHWGDYGFMGHPHVRTPHLDRLAGESLVFRRGYVPSSLCSPSLASIITGQFPHQHRVTSNDPAIPPGMAPKQFNKSAQFRDGREVMNRFMDAQPTLPRTLAQRGYLALQTGKWWQGDFRRGGFTHGMTKGGRHGDEGLDIGRKTMAPIVEFLAEAKREKKPFFVWYAPMMPHDPHTPPDRLLARYAKAAPAQPIAKYWAMIEWFDETCGELLRLLADQGVADNTIVTYVADNGWITHPETGRYAPKSKQSQYDGGLRSPLMVRWPGRVTPRASDRLASSLDFYPTLLRAVGAPVPPERPGVDLLDERAVQARDAIFGECFTHNAVDFAHPAASLRWRWMIAGSWKLIVPSARHEPGAVVELYDLAADPHEERNLAATEAARVAALRPRLDAWWNPDR